MFKTRKPLILASASPRRQHILTQLGLVYTCLPANIDEMHLSQETPVDFAQRMARTKAELIADQYPQSFVIGADTVVTIDNCIIGKPKNPADALRILQSLQGRTHKVITGVSIICKHENCLTTTYRTTKVRFNTFPNSILLSYINTGEPMDKAGGYGMQARGGFLVEQIEGSCSNAIGLPMSTCTNLLLQFEVIAPRQQTPVLP